MSMRLSASIYAICILVISFSTICALIPYWRFLIKIVFNFRRHLKKNPHLQHTKLHCFSHEKTLERNFKIRQDGFHLQLLFYKLAKFDGMMLKIEGALILCIVAVLAKTCLEKFTPKVRRTSYNFTSVENSRSSYLAKY